MRRLDLVVNAQPDLARSLWAPAHHLAPIIHTYGASHTLVIGHAANRSRRECAIRKTSDLTISRSTGQCDRTLVTNCTSCLSEGITGVTHAWRTVHRRVNG